MGVFSDASGTGATEVSDEVWLVVMLVIAVVAFLGFRANSRGQERREREATEREATENKAADTKDADGS